MATEPWLNEPGRVSLDLTTPLRHVVLLHHATGGDNVLFLVVILGIVAATIIAMIRGRGSR